MLVGLVSQVNADLLRYVHLVGQQVVAGFAQLKDYPVSYLLINEILYEKYYNSKTKLSIFFHWENMF